MLAIELVQLQPYPFSSRTIEAGDYRATLRERPVRAQTQPGDIAALIAPFAPEDPEQLRIHLHPLVQQLASVRLGAGDDRSATELAH